MTRNTNGGRAPLSDAWVQAEDRYLSASGSEPAAAPTETPAKIERLLRAIDKVVSSKALAAALLASSLLCAPSWISSAAAQTAIGGNRGAVPSSPPPRNQAQPTPQAQPAQPAQAIPAPPMPAGSVFQAIDQSEGI